MRNLGLIAALWITALLPLKSLALGLGEIEVNSFLNQPLDAEIEVLSARPGEIDDLLVSLASRDAFTRAGLERPRHLSELKFAVRKSEEGDSATILVTTRSAVKEPFLNFLVEADWSKGRLLREFTILLDPPFYADQPAAATTAPATPTPEPAATDTMPIAESTPQPSSSTDNNVTEPIALSESSSSSTGSQASSPPASSEYVADESQNIIQGDVLVVKGDTLWSIASRYKDDAHSMAQVMLAFQRTNPNAFTNGNINNMKVGSVLRAPSAAELDALDKQAAYAEVLVQNGLWDEYVARVTGRSPATGGSASSTDTGSATDDDQGELSLLLPGDGDSASTGTGDGAELDQLRTKLALAEEELEASRIENKDLESRIAELQARLSKVEELQKMVEIEDDSLAQIQGGQTSEQSGDVPDGESEDAMAEDATASTPETGEISEMAADEIMKDDEEALIEELLAEEAAAQAEEAAIAQGDIPDGESEASLSDEMTDEQPAQPAAGDAAVGDQMADDDSEIATVTPPPAPVIITETGASGGSSMLDGILPPDIADMIPSLDGLLGDPILLAGIGGLIVLLLILMIIKRRKAAQDDDPLMADGPTDDLFAGDDEDELTPIHLAEAEDALETDIKFPDSDDISESDVPEISEEAEEEDEFAATAIISAADMPEPEAGAPAAAVAEQDDVLNEVDVYLAYGLYDNAEDLLNSSITENPERADYRSKLLDTYFATKKADAFVQEAQNLKSMGDAAKSYWDRVQIMGYELAPDNALFSDAKDSGLSAADLEIAKPQEADFDLGAGGEDDTNFSSTDFDLGDESGGEESAEAGSLQSTMQISEADNAPAAEEAAGEDDLFELPEEIGDELEFSMDDEAEEEAALGDELELPDDLDFGDDDSADDSAGDDLDLAADLSLDDDLDLSDTADDDAESAIDDDDVALDFDIDSDDSASDDDLDLDDAVQISASEDDDDPAMQATSVITPNFEETEVMDAARLESGDDDSDDDDIDVSSLDLGMEDTSLKTGDQYIEETGELQIDMGALDETGEISLDLQEDGADEIDTGELVIDTGDDDEEDISIIDFGGDDFEETGEGDAISADDDAFSLDDDDSEEVRTGTFAPGDFDEPTAAINSLADIDDIDDLALPDDVDEVSTKLDLARAFIDMGDTEGARGSLEEVMSEGNDEQKAEAKSLLDQI